jgi:hypothetical protein
MSTVKFLNNTDSKLHLGMIICKVCNNVVDTLPTNGVTKIYGVCKDIQCMMKSMENERR